MKVKYILIISILLTSILLTLPCICLSQQSNQVNSEQAIKSIKTMAESLNMDLDNKWLKDIVYDLKKHKNEMNGNLNYNFLKHFKGDSKEFLLKEAEVRKYILNEINKLK